MQYLEHQKKMLLQARTIQFQCPMHLVQALQFLHGKSTFNTLDTYPSSMLTCNKSNKSTSDHKGATTSSMA